MITNIHPAGSSISVLLLCTLAILSPASVQGLQLKNLPDTPTADRFALPTDRVWPAEVGGGDICLWHDDKFAALSIVVDDHHVPEHSFWTQRMTQYGWRMTWVVITGDAFICSGNETYGCWSDMAALRSLGHDVQSHSMTHQTSDNTRPDAELVVEYEGSKSRIEANLSNTTCNVLAYPYGQGKREIAADYFFAARGVVGGINQANRIDYLWLNSNSNVGISSNFVDVILTGTNAAGNWPSHPNSKRGWVSAHFHSVASTQATIDAQLAYLATKADDLWVDTHRRVAQYGQERDTAQLSIQSVTQSNITFSVTDDMDDTLFTHPLTVKFRIPDTWQEENVAATQDGDPVPTRVVQHNGNKYALVDVVPDQGAAILRAEGLPSPKGLALWIR